MYKPKHKKRTVPPRSTSTTKTTKRTITRNNDINIQHRPMLFKKRILPKCQNNIKKMQRKIKEIDKYKKRIQLVNKVIKKLMQHMILLVKRRHLKLCLMIILKKDDFNSLEQFRNKLQFILQYKKTEFASYSNQIYLLEEERQKRKKKIVDIIKGISGLRQDMHSKKTVFETERKAILTEYENIILLTQLHEVNGYDSDEYDEYDDYFNNSSINSSYHKESKRKKNRYRSMEQEQQVKKWRADINSSLSKKYQHLIKKEEDRCNNKIASMRNKLIEKSETQLEIMTRKLQMECKKIKEEIERLQNEQ